MIHKRRSAVKENAMKHFDSFFKKVESIAKDKDLSEQNKFMQVKEELMPFMDMMNSLEGKEMVSESEEKEDMANKYTDSSTPSFGM